MRRKPTRGPQVRDAKDDASGGSAETERAPLPERDRPTLADPGLTDLSVRDWKAVFVRAGKEALDDQITDVAAALAYYAFLAIPATLLVSVGFFGVFASPDAVRTIMDKLATVVPQETITLLDESLTRITENRGGGVIMVVLGVLLALWTATGAMSALIRGLNTAYDVAEGRGFLRQRLTAIAMLAYMLFAVALVFGLLVLGPYVAEWLGDAVGLEEVFGWVWWTVQWPILVTGLLFAFAGILYIGPNVDHPRWRFITPGSAVAVVIWLAASGLFALYVSMFGSYNKAWGSLAAVIIMLTWLWLSSVAILFGAEVNAEAERSRELRQGQPADRELQAPTKA